MAPGSSAVLQTRHSLVEQQLPRNTKVFRMIDGGVSLAVNGDIECATVYRVYYRQSRTETIS